ncbi:MAG: hypothetical protein MUW56_08150 [Chryseobacterium sp.]|uniref:hypothetical protein n=1 Tax=Chryseobacterium sp. TaxID=1871047 RepID=UPI0025C0C0AA|nr:hypothetical protein [Chryseobacterium sp.]MCJ7933592.1 hypothetical protein [Chryseobacterium sp.]MCJ7933597.1 hypothetical protein [Chryseobacterium sp.]
MRSSKRKYFLGVLGVVLIFASIQIYFHFYPSNDENDLLFKKIRSKTIKSVIDRKSIDYSNHGATYIVYGNDSLPTHTGWNEKIQIGDSIIKAKGTLKLVIKNNWKIDTLDYESNIDEVLSTNF